MAIECMRLSCTVHVQVMYINCATHYVHVPYNYASVEMHCRESMHAVEVHGHLSACVQVNAMWVHTEHHLLQSVTILSTTAHKLVVIYSLHLDNKICAHL